MGTHYWIVTPRRRWESQRPAVHLCEAGSKRTLCGKLADGWLLDNWNGTFRPELASCLTCKRIYERKERETMDQNEKPVKHAIAGENIRAGALVALDVDECGAFALVKYDPAKHDYQGEPGVLLHDVTAGRRATYRR